MRRTQTHTLQPYSQSQPCHITNHFFNVIFPVPASDTGQVILRSCSSLRWRYCVSVYLCVCVCVCYRCVCVCVQPLEPVIYCLRILIVENVDYTPLIVKYLIFLRVRENQCRHKHSNQPLNSIKHTWTASPATDGKSLQSVDLGKFSASLR